MRETLSTLPDVVEPFLATTCRHGKVIIYFAKEACQNSHVSGWESEMLNRNSVSDSGESVKNSRRESHANAQRPSTWRIPATGVVAALAIALSCCSAPNRELESSVQWRAFAGDPSREGPTSRYLAANSEAASRPDRLEVKEEAVVLRLGLSDCLELSRTKSFEAVLAAIKAEIADARVQAASAFDDLRLTSSLDFSMMEQALETRLTGDTRTREEQTTTKMSVGLVKPFETGTSLGFTHSANFTDTNSPFNTFDWSSGMSLTIKQNLLDGFGVVANRGNYDIALGEQTAISLDQRRERTTRALGVANSYWALVMATDRVTILRDQRERAAIDLSQVRARRERGEALKLDELRAEITVAGHDAALVSAENEALKASDTLIAAINPEMLYGYALTAGYQLTIEPKVRDARADVEVPVVVDSIQLALEKRSDLLSTIRRAENAGIRVRQREQGLMPNLDLEGSVALWGYGGDYAETVSDIGEAKNRRYGLKLSFDMPLSNNADKASLRIAKAEQEQALWAVRDAEVRVIREVLKSIRDMEASIRAREEADRAAELAQAELDAVQSAQSSGVSTSSEVRAARAMLTAKQLEQSKAAIGVELARLAVVAATGE